MIGENCVLTSADNEMYLDVLREFGNIGSGNAASSLATLIGKTVDIAIPRVAFVSGDMVKNIGGGDVTAGIRLSLTGGMDGLITYLLPLSFVRAIVNAFMPMDIKDWGAVDELGFSAMGEMANIASASFVNALTNMTGLFIDISPPSPQIDTLSSIMRETAGCLRHNGDKLIMLKNEFIIPGEGITASIVLLSAIDSFDKLMATLGVL